MRISYIKLKNISTIFSGMKRKEIEIHFPKSGRKLILLIGRNGTGKSAIMRELHPFPYANDTRGKTILKGEQGYKEIHYEIDHHIYVIKHFYQPNAKDGWSVKSFIAKDGKELNGNGNRDSFMEIVENEMGVEQSHMDLLHLASNLVGFIDKKSTDRKNSASDLLKELDIYSKLYKKVNDDSRILKSLLKTVVDKIDKLSIYSEDDERSHLTALQEIKQNYTERKNQLVQNKGVVSGTITTLLPDGVHTFVQSIQMQDIHLRELKKQHQEVDQHKKKLSLVLMEDPHTSLNHIKQNIQNWKNEFVVNQNMIDFYFKQLNQWYQQRDEKTNELKYISSDGEYSQLSQLYIELKKKRAELHERFQNFNPSCTKDDLITAISLLHQIQEFISDIHTLDRPSIKKVTQLLLNHQSVDVYVHQQVKGIQFQIDNLRNTIRSRELELQAPKDKMYVIHRKHDCDCPYRQFFKDVTGITDKDDKNVIDFEKEITTLEYRKDYMMNHLSVAKKIEYVFMILKTNQKLISKIPFPVFDTKHILSSIQNQESFYNEDEITNYIDVLEDYELYQGLADKIHHTKREMQFIEKNGSNLTTIRAELGDMEQNIFKHEQMIQELRNTTGRLERHITSHEKRVDKLKQYIEYERVENELFDQIRIIELEQQKQYQIKTRVDELQQSIQNIEMDIERVDQELTSTEEQMNIILFRLEQFKILHQERAQLEDEFEERSIIREALSSNKGIPLLYLQMYLRDTKSVVNQLLHEVYKGSLEIDDFIINDKEFRIPYIKNGITVEDVSMCSQGERAFIGIAISFALVSRSIDTYNIMRVDEVDGTLDESYRPAFIPVLEKQMDSIHGEQVFIITHNNMFDNYPVDVIRTDRAMDVDNYKNVNIIFDV
jgi:DNA repair exonuclease SbcCD ATPase subunit